MNNANTENKFTKVRSGLYTLNFPSGRSISAELVRGGVWLISEWSAGYQYNTWGEAWTLKEAKQAILEEVAAEEQRPKDTRWS